MRKVLRLTLLVSAITAMAAMAADNSLGTWKVDIAKSKYTPAPIPLKSFTMVREPVEGGVKVTITGERADGTPINASYTAKFDGSASPITGTGAPYDSIALKQVNANTFTYSAKSDKTKYHSNMRLVVAGDGKSMTASGKGTDADGKAMALTLVFEKQ